jgi:hypothetical protein
MPPFVLEDAREYVLPIFEVDAKGDGIRMETRKLRGTAFLVTPKGDALTAAHVIPPPSELPQGRRLVAVVRRGGRDEVVWVNHAAYFEASDLALLKLNIEDTPFLTLSDRPVAAGEDVMALGIPDHEVWRSGKEMRLLKGHVTLSHKHLELSCPIPAGMSGCPVFIGRKVVAYAVGVVTGESFVSSHEEIVQVTPTKDIIKLTELRSVISYGLATPLSMFAGHTAPVFDGLTLAGLIKSRGGSCG